MTILLCAHAGAWNTENKESIQQETEAVKKAVSRGIQKKSLMEAVLEAITVLEDHPALDAGTGSILQMDGIARADAALATNDPAYKKKYAGVLQIAGIKNPCLVAKKILDYGYHSVLSGEYASQFAREEGFEISDLRTEKRMRAYQSQIQELNIPENTCPSYKILAEKGKKLDEKKLSTVGVVGVEKEKKILIAATSTGGLYYGYPGRVGDTGIFGHGIFCDAFIAVVCTGEGDKMIQQMTAAKVGMFYTKTADIQQSVELAVQDLWNYQEGESGIIAVDIYGNIGIAKSTTFLATVSQERE